MHFLRASSLAFFATVVGTLVACGGAGVKSTSQTPPADQTSPTVVSVTPTNGTTNVAIDSSPTATFSESMSAESLTTDSFTVSTAQGASVAGVVSLNGGTATFSPSSALASGTDYTATITTTAKDAAGNALANNFSWSFTTAAAADTTAPTVSSTLPVNNANAVSVTSPIVATFSEPVDSATVTSASFTIVDSQSNAIAGTISLTSNSATFTPAVSLTNSQTYTVTITTAVKDVAGNSLASAYTWAFTTEAQADTTAPTVVSTNPQDGSLGQPLNISLSVTFSEAMKSSTLRSTTFTLASSSGVSVAGTVSVSGDTATLTPSSPLAANTVYTATLSTGATDIAGNALASNHVWQFTTGPAPDTTPPTVSATSPVSGATGVALSTKVTATFSEAMNNASITSASFTVAKASPSAAVAGTVGVAGNTATFTPSASLAGNTRYNATITTAVRDASGNALASNFSWSFTTGAAPDTTPPTVVTSTPANNATNVDRAAAITATFSEPMTNSTLSTTSFTLVPSAGGSGVSGTVSVSGNVATFSHSAVLSASTRYTATITTAAKDAAGNALASPYIWSFTTAAAPDTTPPTITSTSPTDGATAVSADTNVIARFSEAMNNSTITAASFTLTRISNGSAVAGSVSISGNNATLTPSANLAAGTQYTATVTTAVKDAAGNALASNFSWTFTTTATSTVPTLGRHAVAYKRDGASSATVSTSAASTQSSGSSFLTCVGRGVVAAQAPTTDNKFNTYSQIGSAHTYTRYPNSGTACYIALSGAGGTGHIISAPNSSGAPTDETTLAFVEIAGGSQLKDFKWNEVLTSPLTSLSVTTTGPATLVAFWWGDGDGSVAHTATPNNGFTVVDSLLATGSLVQVSVATKNVTIAGTYNVTWTSTEGAQLWLMAIQ